MTLTKPNIDDKYQSIVSFIFNNITREFKVITEPTTNRQIHTFLWVPGSSHYPFIEAIFKNPPPVNIMSEEGKFYMTSIILDVNE